MHLTVFAHALPIAHAHVEGVAVAVATLALLAGWAYARRRPTARS